MAAVKGIGRFVLSFLGGYLMGAMLTGILLALCVLGVVLQLTPEVHLFSGWTLFKVATLEAKRVHLEVDTPIVILPLFVGVFSMVIMWNSQRRRKAR